MQKRTRESMGPRRRAALCIALILGPLLESNLRRGLLQNDDNVLAFVSTPITLLFLALTVLSAGWPFLSRAIVRRRAAQNT